MGGLGWFCASRPAPRAMGKEGQVGTQAETASYPAVPLSFQAQPLTIYGL
jgi:hypothetical protein